VRVECRLHRGQHVEGAAEGVGQEAAPVEPDAVVVAERPTGVHGGPGDLVPRPAVVVGHPGVPGREVVGAVLGRSAGEGEVEAGAVGVGVALVGGGASVPGTRPSASSDGVVEAGQGGPPPGDLDGVDHHAGPPQRRQGRHVVAVGQPAVDEATSRVGARRTPASTTARVASTSAGSASSSTISTLVSGWSKLRPDSVAS
jgi:hypothetical protein